MRVSVQGHCSGGVAKAVLQELYRAATGQHICGEGMSQIVNSDVSYLCLF